MSTITTTNPLTQIQNQLTNIDQEILRLKEDYYIGTITKKQQDEAQTRIQILQARRDVLQVKHDELLKYIQKMTAIKNGTLEKEVRNEACYEYFQKNLQPWQFDYIPSTNAICNICGHAPTRRTGVVALVDPLRRQLIECCSTCHIKLVREKQAQEDSQNDTTE